MSTIRPDLPPFLQPYLPPKNEDEDNNNKKPPFVTLTYAQSLDAKISLGPGIRTTISHPETKLMTQYLRYHHEGILIGTGTVLADDPGLNCKIAFKDNLFKTPRPIVIDLEQKWRFIGSKMHTLVLDNTAKPPIVIVCGEPKFIEPQVQYLVVQERKFDWEDIIDRLATEFNINSLMIEGGATLINKLLLRPNLINALIITIGATYLGQNGVEVSPIEPVKLTDIAWWHGTCDSVICSKIKP